MICQMCGECCRNLEHEDGDYMADTGVIIQVKDGVCSHLTPEGLCGLQDNKPQVCKDYICKK